MLPKAVLSFLGRAVGIAAVVVSPLAAQAAESSDTQKPGVGVEKVSPAHGHRHHKAADKRGRKRGSRHGEAKGTPAAEAKTEAGAAQSAARPGETGATDGSKPRGSSHADEEVTTERASAKSPPKPSSTPLPSLAAAATRPLVEPIATKSEAAIERTERNEKGHAAEPRRTPIVRAAAHLESTDAPASSVDAHREKHPKAPCLHAPVDVTRGTEEQTFSLTRCDGSALESAVEELSILVRPGSAPKPGEPANKAGEASAKKGEASKTAPKDELAPGIKRIDQRLVERLELMIDHFAKPSVTPKVFVVSGYRPTSKGSFHAMGRAIDFRVAGVENTDLIAFCKTLPDTGCGFYPNSSFIHVDVRDSGSGHVSWIDASGPGEKPAYIAAWPPPPSDDDDAVKLLAKLDDLQLLPPPDHEPKSAEGKPAPARVEPPAPADHAEPASITRSLEDE